MNDPAFKSAAWLIAEKTPKHLGHPTIPPIHWNVEGDNLRVLLADGRTVRARIIDQKREKDVSVTKQAGPVTALPVHKSSLPRGNKK